MKKRILAFVLAAVMLIGMMPTTAFADDKPTLTTDITDFHVGVQKEFTFTTTPGNMEGTLVRGESNFSNADAIESLEYYETNNGQWYSFTGAFGPSTGFPLTNATSKFRITFKEAGNYTFTARIYEAADSTNTLAEVAVSFTVSDHDIQLVEGKKPTCTETGYKDYYACTHEGCNVMYKDAALTKTLTNLDLWKSKYGLIAKDASAHSLVPVAGLDPTCTEAGYRGYYECEYCGKMFKDEAGTKTLTNLAYWKSKVGAIPATGHTEVTDEAKEPTCTETGLTEGSHCSACGEVFVAQETIDALGHTWDEGEVTQEPTCTETGVKTFTCSVCSDTKTEDIEAKGHDLVDVEKVDETCSKGGTAAGQKCSVCDYYTGMEPIPEHTPHPTNKVDEKYLVSEANCTTPATYYYSCELCGEASNSTFEDGEALGHTPGEAVRENEVPATCTVDGSYDEVVYCTVCDAEITRETKTIPASHDLEFIEGVEPTCGTAGYKGYYKCKVCGKMFKDEAGTQTLINLKEWKNRVGLLPATGKHTPGEAVQENVVDATCTVPGSYDEVVYCTVCQEKLSTNHVDGETIPHTIEKIDAVAPTCTKTGLTEGEKCSVCDTVITEQVEVPATGHTVRHYAYKDYLVSAATCTAPAVYYKSCSVCDAQLDATFESGKALGHSWDEGVVTKEPTCAEDGVKTYKCTRDGCTETKTEVISATGVHTPGDPVCENEVAATCTAEGSYDEVVYCTVCQAEISREANTIRATGHTARKYAHINYLVSAATCTAPAVYNKSCSKCDAALEETFEIGEALRHAWNEGVVTKEPTCTVDGVKTFTCTREGCGETYTEVIPATGHDWDYENPEYSWAEDYSSCTVTFKCKNAKDDVVPAAEFVIMALSGDIDDDAETITYTITGDGITSVVTTEPTCTTAGEKTHTATVEIDGKKFTTTTKEVIPALGHKWDDGEVTTEPTCTEDGVKTYTCTREGCTETKTEVIPAKGHVTTKVEYKAATCTEDGNLEYYTCANCNVILKDAEGTEAYANGISDTILPMIPHEPGKVYRNDADNHWLVCKNCKVKLEDTVEEHEWNDGVVTTEPTCTEDGVMTYTCTVCKRTKTKAIDALGHDFGSFVSDENGTTHTRTCRRCNDETDTWNCVAGDAVCENYVAPTCTAEGSYDAVTYCTICNQELSRVTVSVDMIDHDNDYVCHSGTINHWNECTVCGEKLNVEAHKWNDGQVTTAATCTEDGVMTYTCTVCDRTKTEVIPATGHNYVAGTPVAPTCTEDGYTTYTCDNCGDVYTDNIVPATGHNTQVMPGLEPTCTAYGYWAYYNCVNCGENFEDIDATRPITNINNWKQATGRREKLAHNGYLYPTVPATCTEDGTKAYWQCTYCNEYFANADCSKYIGNADALAIWLEGEGKIEAYGHNIGYLAAKAPTCTEDGHIKYGMCQNCYKYFDENEEELAYGAWVLPATGHTAAEAVVENYVAAQCKVDGSYDAVVYCEDCGIELSRETATIPQTGHDWGEWKLANNQDKHKRVCANCGAEDYETHKNWIKVDAWCVAPTCTEDGYDVYNCEKCEATTTVTIPALGHDYGEPVYKWAGSGDSKRCDVEFTCTREGCGDVVSLPATVTSEVTLEPTCVDTGVVRYTATVTFEDVEYSTTKDEAIPALGHALETHEAVDPTCTEEGNLLYYYCTRCDQYFKDENATEPYGENEWIVPATGHTTSTAWHNDEENHWHLCKVCKVVLEDTVAAHNWDEGVVTVAPTYKTEGEMTYTCKNCKATKTEAIPALVYETEIVSFGQREAVVQVYLVNADGTRTPAYLDADESLAFGETSAAVTCEIYKKIWGKDDYEAYSGKTPTFRGTMKKGENVGQYTISYNRLFGFYRLFALIK